jgi:hypothetical protein
MIPPAPALCLADPTGRLRKNGRCILSPNGRAFCVRSFPSSLIKRNCPGREERTRSTPRRSDDTDNLTGCSKKPRMSLRGAERRSNLPLFPRGRLLRSLRSLAMTLVLSVSRLFAAPTREFFASEHHQCSSLPRCTIIPAHRTEPSRDAPPARECFASEDHRCSSLGGRAQGQAGGGLLRVTISEVSNRNPRVSRLFSVFRYAPN